MDRILHLIDNNDDGNSNINTINQCIKTKPVIVFVVAPWCGHCQRLEPTIKTIEKKLMKEQELNNVHLIKVSDSNVSNIDVKKPDSYPSIVSMDKGRHYDYKGDREPEDIMNFIRNNISKKNKKNISKNKKTFKIKKKKGKGKYKPHDYKGPGSDDPNWVKKTFNISGGGRKRKNKNKNKDKNKNKNKNKNNNGGGKRKFADITNTHPDRYTYPDRSFKKLELLNQDIQIYVAPHKRINYDDRGEAAEEYAIEVMDALPTKGKFPTVDSKSKTGKLLEIKRLIYKYGNPISKITNVFTSPQQWNELVNEGGDYCMIFEAKYSLLATLVTRFKNKGSEIKVSHHGTFKNDDDVVIIVCIPAVLDPDN